MVLKVWSSIWLISGMVSDWHLLTHGFTMNKYFVCHIYILMNFFLPCYNIYEHKYMFVLLYILEISFCHSKLLHTVFVLLFFFLYSQYPNAEVVNFGTWFLFSFPISLIMLVLTWFWMHWLFLGCKWVQDIQDVLITKQGITDLIRMDLIRAFLVQMIKAEVQLPSWQKQLQEEIIFFSCDG